MRSEFAHLTDEDLDAEIASGLQPGEPIGERTGLLIDERSERTIEAVLAARAAWLTQVG